MSQNGVLPVTVENLGFDWKAPSSTRSDHENFIASIDWSATAVGPPLGWPAQLREAVDFVLADPTPAAVMWGEDLTVRDHFRSAQVIYDCQPNVLLPSIAIMTTKTTYSNGLTTTDDLQ